jgi:Protein of unknown function (DUF2652)
MRNVERTDTPSSPSFRTEADAPAAERYLLLADISGYTGFMAGVEEAHGVDFSGGVPAGYSVLGALLDSVIEGVEPEFTLVKLEGDAVFAVARASDLDGHGDIVLEKLTAMYGAFIDRRTRAVPASDHLCTACPAVAHLDLKVVLHRAWRCVRLSGRAATCSAQRSRSPIDCSRTVFACGSETARTCS